MSWCKRGEAFEKRRGGGGGCCLRADRGMGSGKLVEYSASSVYQRLDWWFCIT